MPNNLIKLWEVSEMFGTVIDFALWNSEESRRIYEWQELVQHEYAIGTKAFNAEIYKYIHDNWDNLGLGWEGAYDQVHWSIPPVGRGHYVSPPVREEGEGEDKPITWEGLMYDYALWAGRSIVMDELGAEFSANRLSPQQYIEEVLEMAFTPPKDAVFTFLSQFYTEDTEVYAFMDKFVWDDEE